MALACRPQAIKRHSIHPHPHVPSGARAVADAALKEPAEAEAYEQADEDHGRLGRGADYGGDPGLGESGQETLDEAESPANRSSRSVVEVVGHTLDAKVLRQKRKRHGNDD